MIEVARTEQVAAPPEVVLAALIDPAFYASLTAVGAVAAPELLSLTTADTTAHLEVRYGFTGELSGPARAAIDPAKLTWVIATDLDRSARTGTFSVVPDHYGELLECSGNYALHEVATGTEERFSAQLTVHFPIFGRQVERSIADAFGRHVAAEAAALTAYCEQR